MLDLSQFASQNFHFASEDLEIKSNTPQVSRIQRDYPEQHEKGVAEGGAAEPQQTCKLCDTECVALCMSGGTGRDEHCGRSVHSNEARSVQSDSQLNYDALCIAHQLPLPPPISCDKVNLTQWCDTMMRN